MVAVGLCSRASGSGGRHARSVVVPCCSFGTTSVRVGREPSSGGCGGWNGWHSRKVLELGVDMDVSSCHVAWCPSVHPSHTVIHASHALAQVIHVGPSIVAHASVPSVIVVSIANISEKKNRSKTVSDGSLVHDVTRKQAGFRLTRDSGCH